MTRADLLLAAAHAATTSAAVTDMYRGPAPESAMVAF